MKRIRKASKTINLGTPNKNFASHQKRKAYISGSKSSNKLYNQGVVSPNLDRKPIKFNSVKDMPLNSKLGQKDSKATDPSLALNEQNVY
jgi:hypothetical protein